MAAVSSDNVPLGDVVIVGGGCYGRFYAGQLLRARERGAATWRKLLVVDRNPRCRVAEEIGAAEGLELIVEDWGPFFDRYLVGGVGLAGPPDTIVPSPLMPHLMFEWLLRRARARWPGREVAPQAVPIGPGTPYDVAAPDGTRYVSFADWLCPTHCVEPATCPIIRAPRTWEMADAMQALTHQLDQDHPTAGPVLFTCRHRVYGVGMFDVATVQEGDAIVARAGAGGQATDVLVGTISACHGAVSLIRLGALTG
jgi:hypothetical protein